MSEFNLVYCYGIKILSPWFCESLIVMQNTLWCCHIVTWNLKFCSSFTIVYGYSREYMIFAWVLCIYNHLYDLKLIPVLPEYLKKNACIGMKMSFNE